MIESQHKRIPWRWVILLTLISQARILTLFATGSMTFTMRKFIESPLIINSVSSLDILFNILVAAPCLYYSHRIWTRFGRRLPFVAASFVGIAAVLLLLPLAKGAVPMGLLVVGWLIFWDVGSTYDTLIMEIIPPDQRGRAGAIHSWCLNATIMLSAIVISGRFDDRISSAFGSVSGEMIIYWWGAGCILLCLVFLLAFVRELPPREAPPQDHGRGLSGAFRSLFAEKTLWPVYLLVFSSILMLTGLGAIDPLLMTEQWGYSKQDMGTNVFVGGTINLVLVIPLIGILTDKMSRLKMYIIGVTGILFFQICYYIFVQFVLPDQRPSIAQIIFFGQMMSMIGQFQGIALMPLIYEFIPRDKMGTAQAGLNFVRSITRLLTLNGIGIWVTWYSRTFLPEGRYDYFSGYLFMILMNAIGLGFLLWFALQVKRKNILPLGRLDFHPVEEEAKP